MNRPCVLHLHEPERKPSFAWVLLVFPELSRRAQGISPISEPEAGLYTGGSGVEAREWGVELGTLERSRKPGKPSDDAIQVQIYPLRERSEGSSG